MIINIINPHASYYIGGTEVVTLEQALALGKRGHKVRYITWQTDTYSDYFSSFLAKAQKYDITPVFVPHDSALPLADGTWPRYYYLSNRFGIAAQPIYQRFMDADLFVSHLSADSLYLPSGVKHILHLHGTPSQPDAVIDMAMNLPNSALAHATSIRDWWQSHYPQMPIGYFRNGVDTASYHGLPTDNRPIDVLYAGRFLEHKGIDDLLLSVSGDQAVVIAGHGPYIEQLRTLAKSRNLDRVQFVVRPTTEKLKELYRSAKVFACPSRAKEGVLTTMLEAGSSGAAVVTASGSGMTDLIVDAQNGLVVQPGTPTELQATITLLLENNTKRIELAQALQRDIQSHWSWDAKGEELEQEYEKLLVA